MKSSKRFRSMVLFFAAVLFFAFSGWPAPVYARGGHGGGGHGGGGHGGGHSGGHGGHGHRSAAHNFHPAHRLGHGFSGGSWSRGYPSLFIPYYYDPATSAYHCYDPAGFYYPCAPYMGK